MLRKTASKKDPEYFDFWVARLRGEQIFAEAWLDKGEKKMARDIYEKADPRADPEAPKKYAARAEGFKKQVWESLQKCG